MLGFVSVFISRFLPNVQAFVLTTSLFIGWSMIQAKADEAKLNEKILSIQGDLKSYQFELPNGLTVVLTPNKEAPTTSIDHWVKVGSLQEKPGITGIAHLFEHMMFRPLSKDAANFDTLVRPLGGDVNADTRYGATFYTTTISNGKLKEALKIESDRFKTLVVTDDLLKVEREAVRSEYSMGIDSKPTMDLWFTLYQKGFPNHPYGWTIMGERGDLDRISAKDCNEFFQKFYRPNNVGLFVAGDFKLEDAKAWVVENYSSWKRGENSTSPAPYQHKGLVRGEGKLVSQARNLLLGYRLEPLNEHNFTLFTLADHILAESSNSLAQKRLVYQEKIAASIEVFNTEYDFGLSQFLLELKPGSSFDRAIDDFSKLTGDLESLSDQEYAAYLAEYRYRLAESVLRNVELNENLALFWGKYGSIEALARNLNKPPQIPKAEMVAYLKKLLAKDNLIAVNNKQKKS